MIWKKGCLFTHLADMKQHLVRSCKFLQTLIRPQMCVGNPQPSFSTSFQAATMVRYSMRLVIPEEHKTLYRCSVAYKSVTEKFDVQCQPHCAESEEDGRKMVFDPDTVEASMPVMIHNHSIALHLM